MHKPNATTPAALAEAASSYAPASSAAPVSSLVPSSPSDGTTEETYTVHRLAELSGVSVRTLHHYDSIGLLVPRRAGNGYRSYGAAEVDRLQQILLYRHAGMALADIRTLLDNPEFDPHTALRRHLETLRAQHEQLEQLIESVQKTLASMEGGSPMSTEEKFEAFKADMVKRNEETYGKEVRQRWGDDVADASNAKMMNLSQADYQRQQELAEQLSETLRQALAAGDAPESAAGQRAADLHRQWLCLFWPDGMYSPQAHAGLAAGYLADERFRAHYDAIAPSATDFLVAAIQAYCAK